MDTVYLGVITLLRSALNAEPLKLPEDFDWDKASDLLYRHHLTGLGIQGAALCGVPRTHPTITKMTLQFCQSLKTSRLQMQKLDEVFALFEANNIEYLPVKGSVIKPLYPRMEYRIMGDADILIRPDQYPLICSLLPTLGLEEKDNSDYEYTWESPVLTLELHRFLVSTHFTDYFAYYENSWQYARKCDHGSGYRLTPEAHFVYFFVHFAKHYMNGSICAKDLCDIQVWRKAYPNMDEAYILRQISSLQLTDFYHNILALLDNWFNGVPATEASEFITLAAFQGGVCTDFNTSAADNVMQRHSNEADSLFQKKLKWFLHALFPSCSTLSYAYPVLEKAPFLLPLFWVIRWFDALFRDRDKLKRGMIVMQTDEHKLSEHTSHLDAVGLGKCKQQ